jgi:hypothetical protein
MAAIAAALASSSTLAQGDARTVEVDCTAGESIAQALTSGNQAKRLVIVVRGTCTESVQIERDDVTVRGDATGGAIHGPDATVNTVNVTGHRVTLETLTVSGGRNGISATGATNLTLRGATVQSTGRNGIVYAGGSSGTVDDCVVQSNARDGVSVDAASVTIINSTISQNARMGVLVALGAAARIGVDIRNVAAGNTISQNGTSGIALGSGGTALIAMNQIIGNGGQGVSVVESRVDMPGGNTISGNATQGVFARASSVQFGGPALGFSSVNTISGNGGATSAGGVFAFLGSSVVVRDAVISNNMGPGLVFSLRSQGQMFGSTIQNNSGDGIRLLLGSALLPLAPGSTVSGNTGWGIQCFDAESSVVNAFPPFLTLSGNIAGDVSPGCTGF